MKKIWINKKYICRLACKWTAGVFTMLGFVGTFASLNDILPCEWKILFKLLLSLGILCGTWGISFVACAIWFSNKKRISILEANNGCHVYVEYGDILSDNVIEAPKSRRNIVIGVNRCFDTIIDNDLVSDRSLHGLVFKRMYKKGIYDENTLNDTIQKDLIKRQNLKSASISRQDKRRGNLKRYDVGTVAEVKASQYCTYLCLGLSIYDYDLSACTSQQEYVLAMQKLIEYCHARSQGDPVIMPLIGAGLSKTKNDEKSILEFLVKLFKLNKDLIVSDIHIVIRDSGKGTISITEI